MIKLNDYRKRNHGFYIAINPGRIEKLQNAKREFEKSQFNPIELRGLSKAEKKFLEDNNLSKVYDRFYLFIGRNLATGKKQLYAQDKLQAFFPNGYDITPGVYNYQIWLIFDARYANSYREPFSKFYYEYRFIEYPQFTKLYAN